MKLKKFIPFCFLFIGTLALPQPSFAQEKIEVLPIIQSSKGLSGKNFNYKKKIFRGRKLFFFRNFLKNYY